MEAYDLIPDKNLPEEVKLIEKKKHLSGPIGIKSSAEGEYDYPTYKGYLTVEIEEESSPEISKRRVNKEKELAKNPNQRVEEIKILDTQVMKISTKFGENDIDFDLIWNRGPFFIVVYGQPFNIVESLAKLTIQNFVTAKV